VSWDLQIGFNLAFKGLRGALRGTRPPPGAGRGHAKEREK
jgi:hypothetical protein